MLLVRQTAEIRAVCEQARARGQRVGFVPTMGALHEGHLSLVREARRRVGSAGVVVVSIFVNPTQFGPNEDLARYPRDPEGDVRKVGHASVGADVAFAPEPSAMYPAGDETRVRVGAIAEPLCGRFRPGHFEGVATVVAKLLVLVGACVAVFGRKDYQQLLVVRRMARDLFLPVEIVGHPIVRESDGLAMSSRNAYLSREERQRALCLVRGLDAAACAFAAGERDARAIEHAAREPVERAATSIDYVEARDADSLADISRVPDRAVVAIACRIGNTRLIDNIVLGQDPAPLASTCGARRG